MPTLWMMIMLILMQERKYSPGLECTRPSRGPSTGACLRRLSDGTLCGPLADETPPWTNFRRPPQFHCCGPYSQQRGCERLQCHRKAVSQLGLSRSTDACPSQRWRMLDMAKEFFEPGVLLRRMTLSVSVLMTITMALVTKRKEVLVGLVQASGHRAFLIQRHGHPLHPSPR